MPKKKAKIEKISKWELKVTYWWELAERATQEEKELLVAEAEHFDKCCEQTEECPNPTPWCCNKCPSRLDELRAKYKELDDDFDNVLEPLNNNPFWLPFSWWYIIAWIVVVLLLYMWLK